MDDPLISKKEHIAIQFCYVTGGNYINFLYVIVHEYTDLLLKKKLLIKTPKINKKLQ